MCARQTTLVERRTAIPRHLLAAISLAESGRWDKTRRANVAWPWTVTSGGKGRFFETKAEALAEVEILMTEGVRNIDVGCMQINLYYHGGAFETLEEAFDPEANTTYAASYLKNMFSATGNWTDAAGYYHSMTPARNGPYKKKVLEFWRRQGGAPGDNTAIAGRTPGNGFNALSYSPIDHARMARLNARFKARKQAGNIASGNGAQTKADTLQATAARQLQGWREARSRGLDMQHLLAMRRAELQLKRKRELDRLGKGGAKNTFAAKRAKQLRDWRLKISGQGVQTAVMAEATPKITPQITQRPKLSATGMAASASGASVR